MAGGSGWGSGFMGPAKHTRRHFCYATPCFALLGNSLEENNLDVSSFMSLPWYSVAVVFHLPVLY